LELPEIQDEKINFENDSQIQTSIEPKLEQIFSQSSQILPIELESTDTSNLLLTNDKSNTSSTKDVLSSDMIPFLIDHPFELPCTNGNRERTSSDASSATVDYDFDTETCTALASNSVDIDI